jgi:hypothetical protein
MVVVLGGCSLPLATEKEATGSIRRPSHAADIAPNDPYKVDTPQDLGSAAATLRTTDWGYAKGALAFALAGEPGSAVGWSNPARGSSGTFARLDRADGQCRRFVGSLMAEGRSILFEGRACQNGAGWEIADLKPNTGVAMQ